MAASLLDVTPGGDICAMRARANSSRAFLAGAVRGDAVMMVMRSDASSCPKSFSNAFCFVFGKRKWKFFFNNVKKY